MARILFSTFGSAGDLFPLLPIARRLREEGHDVSFVVPRVLGLYLRTTELEVAAVGDGTELRVAGDEAIFTTRFAGWASHRRALVSYVAPTLVHDVAKSAKVIDRVAPDVVVTMPMAVAARVAAMEAGVAHVGCSVYPHLARLAARPSTAFARPFQREVAAVASTEVLDRHGFARVGWGVDPEGVLLHDPVLLGPNTPAGSGELVGFPYGDHLPGSPDDLAAVESWLDAGEQPAVLVTLGSFVGSARNDIWDHVAGALRANGLRGVVVGARAQLLPPTYTESDDLVAVGYLPLSRLLHRFVGVVHHGGLGTMFATLAAGKPAVVVPQGFDQAHVARLVEQAGVGVVATAHTLAAALADLRDRPELTATARAAGAALVPPDVATRRAVDIVVGHAG